MFSYSPFSFTSWKLLKIIVILLSCGYVATQIVFETEPTKQSNFPIVRIYDAAEDEPNYDNNGSFTFNLSDQNKMAWLGLECEYDQPISWIFDLDHVSK